MATMMQNRRNGTATEAQAAAKMVLCAVYVRKSTDENLQGDFTTLDNQAEYCRSFIRTREPMGWRVYHEVYSDAGFSGKNMERPALQKLIEDARRGRFQVVVCYKYDRLTRNTRDFLEMLSIFEKQGIDFVSVTQPIDTTSPVGRLMRSILMEFAQFEREMIAERTRDKLGAMIKKGKWTGGPPPMGYDRDRASKKLVVNEVEAEVVREMFQTYIKTGSLSATASRLNGRGWRMKLREGLKGKSRGGGRFFKTNLNHLLRNPIYIGKRAYRGELYQGEQQAIIDEATFFAASARLDSNRASNGTPARDRHEFLLRGLVHCAACGSVMIPHFSRSGERVNLYYRCATVNRTDRRACPVRSVPARALETFILEQIALLAKDERLIAELVQSAKDDASELAALRRDKGLTAAELGKAEAEVEGVTRGLGEAAQGSAQWRVLMDRLGVVAPRVEELRARLAELEGQVLEAEVRQVDAGALQRNLGAFVQAFEGMSVLEKKELIRLVIREIIYDKPQSRVRLGLVCFQDFEWDLAQFSTTIDPRTKWLPK